MTLRPTVEVQIDGGAITGVTQVTANFGIAQDSDACTVEGYTLDASARQTLVVYAGDGSASGLMFNGEVLEADFELWQPKSSLVGTGYMSRLSKPWGNGYYEYTSQTAGAIETNLIEKSGIDVSLHHVVDSGRTVGSVGNELRLRDSTPPAFTGDPQSGTADIPLNLIRDLLKLDLYWIAARSNGAIYIDAMAVGTPVASYSPGTLRQFRWRKGSPNDIKNKWLIKGFEDLGFAFVGNSSATNALLISPAAYNADGFQNFMLESDAACQAVSDAYLAFYNRLIPECQFQVDGNLTIQPGVTVTFAGAGLSATDFFITQVTHTVGADFVTSGTGIAI